MKTLRLNSFVFIAMREESTRPDGYFFLAAFLMLPDTAAFLVAFSLADLIAALIVSSANSLGTGECWKICPFRP